MGDRENQAREGTRESVMRKCKRAPPVSNTGRERLTCAPERRHFYSAEHALVKRREDPADVSADASKSDFRDGHRRSR
jgi:hypothetical protein